MVVIAAVARNGVIGANGRLPWHLPEDLARFRRLTSGEALVMGRATFDSIGRPLPGRTNIVLTRRRGWGHDGVVVATSLEEALELAAERGEDAFIAGGAEVYRLGVEVADRMEITEVDAEPEGDTLFPSIDWSVWEETDRDAHPGFSFVSYRRSRPGRFTG